MQLTSKIREKPPHKFAIPLLVLIVCDGGLQSTLSIKLVCDFTFLSKQ